MVRITEELIRKRAEHNEGEIFSLEELSLHQMDIERIEFIDKWCRELKILYLQSNLIPKLENLSRLKKVNYINLALNNIERIENLEGCEFLNKLDLTVNFIGEITSVENLIDNYHLRELHLTGNPCALFNGYRDFVIATLPQLKNLDGIEITRTDQIKALQNYKEITKSVVKEQEKYLLKRKHQKEEYAERSKEQHDIDPDEFWNEKSEYTPESRIETHNFTKKMKEKDENNKKNNTTATKKPRKYFSDTGQPYNCNEPKVNFELKNEDDSFILNVWVFKHMDSSLVDVDLQPNYVRVTMKEKVLQLALSEEIKCDSSKAQRSQITGVLTITMPKLNPIVRIAKQSNESQENVEPTLVKKKTEYLEVDEKKKPIDYKNILKDKKIEKYNPKAKSLIRENSPNFIDDPDVPPLI